MCCTDQGSKSAKGVRGGDGAGAILDELGEDFPWYGIHCATADPRSIGSFRITYSYLVDPASSHMLVSKIKPCMSKYKQLYTVKLRTAHYISNYLFDGTLLHG